MKNLKKSVIIRVGSAWRVVRLRLSSVSVDGNKQLLMLLFGVYSLNSCAALQVLV